MGAQIKDVDLLKLSGTVLASPSQLDVSYRLEELIGEGAHGVVFLALQRLPRGMAPVVVKLLRPRAVRELAGLAGTAIDKEVAALKRLSERAPPTPFVVQFLDAGTFRLADSALDLPWVAVEYIHGGLEGTTLRARVAGSVARSGCAFDIARARGAIKCIALGMQAIHEVGVLHRDVTPGNVLCCGFAETEIFKLADFGLARVSSASTYGNVLLGTPGYCAPEQSFPDKVEVGPYTDVFGMACTFFYLLTGEAYFAAPSIPEMLVAVQTPDRRSLLDTRALCAELRSQRAACLELDRELARATRADPRERHQTAAELAAALLPLLTLGSGPSVSTGPSFNRAERLAALDATNSSKDLRWTVRREPGGASPIGSVGWDSNGHFLAASRDGLVYWDGAGFRDVPFDWPWVPRVVRRSGAGRWLLAGEHGVLVDFTEGKVERRISAGNGAHFVAATGRFDDIVVGAAKRSSGGFELWAWINGRFLEPLELPDVAEVTACAPLTDTSWIFVAKANDGSGLLLEFRPLGHRFRVVDRTPGRALLACATQIESSTMLAGGQRGYLAELGADGLAAIPLPNELDVTAVALDVLGAKWAATPGTLWTHEDGWKPAWSKPEWASPFISIFADVGRIVAVTADGAIVQAERSLAMQAR